MIAAQCLAPLPFRQADGKPPGGVQDRERAEDDKEDRFVHVKDNVVVRPPVGQRDQTTRRLDLRYEHRPKPRPDGDTQLFKNSCAAGDRPLRFARTRCTPAWGSAGLLNDARLVNDAWLAGLRTSPVRRRRLAAAAIDEPRDGKDNKGRARRKPAAKSARPVRSVRAIGA
jgi:hypothetical protein